MPSSVIGELLPAEIRDNPDEARKLDELDALENEVVDERLALIRRIYAEEGGLEGRYGALSATARRLGRRPQYVDKQLKRHGAVKPEKDKPDA